MGRRRLAALAPALLGLLAVTAAVGCKKKEEELIPPVPVEAVRPPVAPVPVPVAPTPVADAAAAAVDAATAGADGALAMIEAPAVEAPAVEAPAPSAAPTAAEVAPPAADTSGALPRRTDRRRHDVVVFQGDRLRECLAIRVDVERSDPPGTAGAPAALVAASLLDDLVVTDRRAAPLTAGWVATKTAAVVALVEAGVPAEHDPATLDSARVAPGDPQRRARYEAAVKRGELAEVTGCEAVGRRALGACNLAGSSDRSRAVAVSWTATRHQYDPASVTTSDHALRECVVAGGTWSEGAGEPAEPADPAAPGE